MEFLDPCQYVSLPDNAPNHAKKDDIQRRESGYDGTGFARSHALSRMPDLVYYDIERLMS